jgi:coproporphyrinogen III oxidase-like Fe-S oxidoreductase
MTLPSEQDNTQVGNYFVANYPPFSVWSPDYVAAAKELFSRPPEKETELGLYLHIPFCRKRCKFCYFRVYTDRNHNDRDHYLDALIAELRTLTRMPVLKDRAFDCIYVGGGTPSALHEKQIDRLGSALKEMLNLEHLKEVTFECEPGTMTERKVAAIKRFGCTRLSLGVEHFDDHILEENGRAHLSPEIHSAYDWIEQWDFDQVNIDLIAGMVDETDATWTDCVAKAVTMAPDSITIYQMELPYNTVYSRDILEQQRTSRVADWKTKRRWVEQAFASMSQHGYEQSSAYTMVKSDNHRGFLYRDALWHGADLAAGGVASFGHIQGMHYQNHHDIDPYNEVALGGSLPIYRAYQPSPLQQLIREMILQFKLGHIRVAPFREKFGIDISQHWNGIFSELEAEGMLQRREGRIDLSAKGLHQVDGFLPRFYEDQFRNARYA